MLKDKKILECELEYTKCFSEFFEDDSIIRFYDNQLLDMHYHNCIYIKQGINATELKCIIEDEISRRLSEKWDFCNIISSSVVSRSMLTTLSYLPETSLNGYYSFDISRSLELKAVFNCDIKKVKDQKMIEDTLYCELQYDEKVLGKDFCMRRCYRRGKVYVADEGVNSYICYHNGNVIGICDLFIYNGVAKIEDFAVLPKYQRKGYGTTILKELIGIAIKEGCHTVYLVADEEDTAKEMYKKNGFYKIGERTDLFFYL